MSNSTKTITKPVTKTPTITNVGTNLSAHWTNLFKSLKGCRMMSLTINTEPKLRRPKSNPLAGRIRKVQKINGAVGFSYEKAVNRQKIKDNQPPDFEALKRRSMVHIGGAILQNTNTGEHYVFLRPKHKDVAVYYVDGKLTPVDYIKDKLYFPPKKKDSGNISQGVSKEVPYINIKTANIVYVKGF